MAVEQLLTQHIDTWTSALRTRSTAGRGTSGKIDLYGIKKLRELILELAVRGKLVPQDPNDEPASELLKRIAAEKAELVKQGKIKKQKPLPEISEDEKPFELPVGWVWVRLGNVGVCSTGKTPSTSVSSHFNGNIPFVGPGQITQCGEITQGDKFLSEDGMLNSTEANNGDVFTVCIGGSIGKSAIVSERVAFNQQINSIRPVLVDSKYLYFSISTKLFISSMITASTGSATPIINRGKWESLLIPCAPVTEQHSIVAKVNELMALCDQLEQQSLTSLDAHYQLVETLLATLTASQNTEELAENWARISQHFDTLFTTEASIDALKQTILQLAVMGKLVPQDPNDEPASELLKRIEQEKAQLVKEGKIKKQKPLPPISEEEKPFELPVGWEWCRLGHCIHLISGQHLKPNEYTENIIEGAIPYITGPAEFGDLNPTYSKFTIEKRAVAEPKDILVTCKGAGLGKLNVANVEIAISRQLMAIRTVRANCDYFKLLLSSMYDYFQAKGVGIAIPGISREDVIEPVISLPPLNEQERIVSRVNALFGTCDHLKSRLQSAQQTQLHLADALTEAALN
ncbi:restriction endonuclease subunit S [Rahnella aceris]|uniref:restriction endonuclease subunit S n=1 Tax=Rahnella sp. (strain Y9602) TaxID=2703885 RepID=UPI001C266597|nr:restriction endonuclease subunit S [Rahnella aceris]MBU9842199.1 restriction endonuclease subunit S [Rahnella aceris]